jgi:hypothetical protein
MTTNEHVRDHVDAYLHELLPPDDQDRVREHCAACSPCGEALAEARRRLEALQALPPLEAGEELLRATEARLDEAARPNRRRGPWTWLRSLPLAGKAALVAVAAGLLLAAVNIYYARLSPSPYDLRVLGQTELPADVEASLRVIVFNRNAEAGAAGVPVQISLARQSTDKAITLARFETDQSGTGQPRFRLPDWADGEYQLRVSADTADGKQTVSRTVRLQHRRQVMLSTDRPVYQPGQTILMRGLTLRSLDLRPVGGAEAVFVVMDPKGNRIFRHKMTTSRFGIAAAECPLADEVVEGTYRVSCQVGDQASSAVVEIKRYVLPKFKLDANVTQTFYRPGESVQGTVRASYFFGKPVAGARVRVQAYAGDGAGPFHKVEARTDADGAATFAFPVPEEVSREVLAEKDATLMLAFTVTDSASQEQSLRISRPVTRRPLRVEAIPEAGTLVKGVPNVVYLTTTYADGRPARTRLNIPGFTDSLDTDEQGVASFVVTPERESICLELRANDTQQMAIRREIILHCGCEAEDFLVRPDRSVYEAGAPIRLTILGGGAGPVFLDFVKNGQCLGTAAAEMRAGGGECRVELPPRLLGAVWLCAYRYGAQHTPFCKSQLLHVRPADRLKILADSDQNEYRPGQTARLGLRLVDAAGKPAPGAVSLWAVDEAVFSVGPQLPRTGLTPFTFDQREVGTDRAPSPWLPTDVMAGKANQWLRVQQALSTRAAEGRSEEQLLPAETTIRTERPATIGNRGDSHSLDCSTYAENSERVAANRKAGLRLIGSTWAILALLLISGLVYVLWRATKERFHACMILGGTLCLFVALILSSSIGGGHEDWLLRYFGSRKEAAPAAVEVRFEAGLRHGTTIHGMDRKDGSGLNQELSRVREWFPETLLWRPELVTDDQGRVRIEVPLADSITTWRIIASAITADGRLGATQAGLRVFQPFFVEPNLPVALTRGDEVAVPVVVYNYLDRPQTVSVTLSDTPGADRLDPATRKVELPAGEVRSVSFRIRARQVGRHELRVTAHGSGVADAVKRTVEVVPDGRPVERVVNGTLRQPADIALAVPENAVEDSVKALVRLYPSSFSQLVEGLDALFRRPYGCFEQTSSTTYPNVLALDYLQRSGKGSAAVEAKARHYIHLGYQRLLSFEVQGGGFDWFGRPPANRTLTAYGLMEFADMARVHDVDPDLIARTRKWLLAQRRPDGSWDPEAHQFQGDPTGRVAEQARLRSTAYIAWALFARQNADEGRLTRDYLLRHNPAAIGDPYTLALVGNALLALDPKGPSAHPYLDRLRALSRSDEQGKFVWWERRSGARTLFHGGGRSGSVETTALTALALIAGKRDVSMIHGALAWLAAQRDGRGGWASTQATVLALKALLAEADRPRGTGDLHVRVTLDGKPAADIAIPPDQVDVVRLVNLSSLLSKGAHRVRLESRDGQALPYQVTFRYHVPEDDAKGPKGLSIRLAYDRKEAKVQECVAVTATVTNEGPRPAPMVMVELPVPAGFALQGEDLEKLVRDQMLAKVQHAPGKAVLYLRELAAGRPLTIPYRLRAVLPGTVAAPAAVVYEFYDPDRNARSAATRLSVMASR